MNTVAQPLDDRASSQQRDTGEFCREGFIQTRYGRLFHVDEGPTDAPPILLVMGLGCQLTLWPESLVNTLLMAGFRVIRFDNRDIGLSDPAGRGIKASLPALMLASKLGIRANVNYTLYDMVEDTIDLINALALKHVHLVGASMGGMISQLTAAIYPQRVSSLCSIMSNTNEPGLPMPKPSVLAALNGWGMPKGDGLPDVLVRANKLWDLIGSPGIAETPSNRTRRVTAEFARSYRPEGRLRHAQAITATGGFAHLLGRIACPTQIIHGDADPLVRVEGGKASARAIPNARLSIIPGMAHDFPPTLVPEIASLIVENARLAR